MADDAREKAARQRRCILDEILKSEQSYVAGLDVLYDKFYMPCFEFAAETAWGALGWGGSSIINNKEVQIMFPYVPAIRECNRIFLNDLECEFQKVAADDAAASDVQLMVGPIFTRFAPVLKIYTEFMNNYQASADLIDKLCDTRSSFKQWKDSVELALMIPMGQYMITPVQRIPRYKLLLTELLKFTEVSTIHHDLMQCNAMQCSAMRCDAIDHIGHFPHRWVCDATCTRLHTNTRCVGVGVVLVCCVVLVVA
jgi:hypothetical protein